MTKHVSRGWYGHFKAIKAWEQEVETIEAMRAVRPWDHAMDAAANGESCSI